LPSEFDEKRVFITGRLAFTMTGDGRDFFFDEKGMAESGVVKV